MPSKTFYNLSQEKQQKIIDASKKEFSNNLYQDVSLNQIIKNSNISRGSFYMYFTDKEDLYFYLLNEYKANFEKVIIKTLMIIMERYFLHLETYLHYLAII